MSYDYRRLLTAFDANVPALIARQIDDASHPDEGGFLGPDRLAGPNQISSATTYGYAYLLPESAYCGDLDLVARIERAAAWGRRVRTPAGRFDLLATNFDSSPDTGFTVQALAPVVRAARLAAAAGDDGARRIEEALGELIRTAAPGMVSGGFHTPNHRWVLVSALSMAVELYPDLQAQVHPTIEAYLAETIDVNADGEFIERSTSVYNAVVDRALRLAAESLNRWELLDPVRANLEMSFHLMHADATVVTSISSRQDRGARVVPAGLADSYYTVARRDSNGRFAAMADWLLARSGGGSTWDLEPFLTHPEWRDDDIPRAPVPTSYRRYFPVARLWRVRRGQTSATLAEGLDTPFSLRHGAAELSAVRVSSTYFATGRFVGTAMAPIHGDRGASLHHAGANPLYPEKAYDRPIYWLPIGDGTRVDAANWQEVRGRRQTYELPPMAIDLDVQEVPLQEVSADADQAGDGTTFDLRVRTTGGVDGVPVQIELLFEPGGTIEVQGALLQAQAGTTMFLTSGEAVFRVGSDEITIGPGACAHTTWKMHNSPDAPETFRLLVTLLSPVDHTLRLRTGNFSA